ncbi:DUF5368 domain-containing protein [Hoeflea sp. TYP-13]|uniref:DUF5368 domain-containing protein n=1 Tax=Hoeflea sp. TYP-13 TaxID=3230023 RepID=UPI0034C6CF3A
MKELSFTTIIAVLEEVFGRGLFLTMVSIAAIVTLAYLYVLIRDRAVSWRKFLLAQLSMPVGAVLAIVFVQMMTDSGFGDIGGPIDLLALFAIALVGAIGMAILVYTIQSLLWPPRDSSAGEYRQPGKLGE